MAAMRGSRNNLFAGVFVLVAIALAVLCIAILTNLSDLWKRTTTYVVRFSMIDGADGLDRGSSVKIGGQKVGSVDSWKFNYDEFSGEPINIDVLIRIRSDIKLIDDADVTLLKPLLGGQSSLNIASGPVSDQLGLERIGPHRLLEPGSVLLGRLGSPGFVAPADYQRVRSIIARVENITRLAEEAAPMLITDAETAVANVRIASEDGKIALADARAVVADARQQWPAWSKRASDILAQVESATSKAEAIVTSVDDGLREVREGVAGARKLIADNTPSINEALENVRSVIADFRRDGYAKLTGALDSASSAMREAEQAAGQVNGLLVKKRPELEQIVTSANLAAQQLRLATTEIRSSPWRLLYQPTKKELDNELLYNSVRSYSTSVSELRIAADALRAVAATPGGADAVVIDDLSAKLQAAFSRYQDAERQFLDRWVKPVAGSPAGAPSKR
jgi:ABC-type transporter Mla subunit MlaD